MFAQELAHAAGGNCYTAPRKNETHVYYSASSTTVDMFYTIFGVWKFVCICLVPIDKTTYVFKCCKLNCVKLMFHLKLKYCSPDDPSTRDRAYVAQAT